MALFIATLASPHHRHEFWTACLESKGCVRYCGSSCFNKAKRSQKHRNLLPHAAKPLGTMSRLTVVIHVGVGRCALLAPPKYRAASFRQGWPWCQYSFCAR